VLAVQNMNACNAVDKSHEIEFQALEGSLNMMSKGWPRPTLPERFTDEWFHAIVLNDVLDL
jgi:hypothetical protein